MNRGAARQIDWRCSKGEHLSECLLLFCNGSPQLWSDAEQIVDHCQIFRSAEPYSAETLHTWFVMIWLLDSLFLYRIVLFFSLFPILFWNWIYFIHILEYFYFSQSSAGKQNPLTGHAVVIHSEWVLEPHLHDSRCGSKTCICNISFSIKGASANFASE